MTPNKSTIDQLFNGSRVFKIPFYQRSYVWGEKQWERFLNDMIDVGHQEKDYFLGVIILKQMVTGASQQGDYKLVIDGQQRLTTIAVFLKVLYMKLGQSKFFERKFIMPDEEETLSIQHSNIDKDDFEKVMRLTSLDELPGSSNIIKAYNYFREHVDEATIDLSRLRYNVQVIDIVIDSNDDEQQIFDTINSLGVDLTTAELLKNHLFDEHSIPDYNKYWMPVFESDEETIAFWAADLLKGRIKQRNVEAFLSAYLQIKVHEPGRDISAAEKLEYSKGNALFYNYKKFIATYFPGHELDFVKDLAEYAKIFHDVFTPDIAEHTLPATTGLNRINFIIYVLGNTTLMPYVMYVEKNISNEDSKIAIYDYLEAYMVRRLICVKPTKNYSDLFSENLIGCGILTRDELVEYINCKDSANALAMPSNQDLLASMLESEHPNYRGLAILYLMESKMRTSQKLSTQLFKYSAYTLEHLMPQKWQKNWPLPTGVEMSERIHKIRTIGNFTLITQSLNSAIGNEKWSVKLEGKNNHEGLKVYANGLFTLHQTLELGVWDEQTIDARATWLAYQASILWPSLLPLEKPIKEPELADGILTTDIIDDDSIPAAKRDKTQYSLDGKHFMGKSLFVHLIVSKYITKHKRITFEELSTVFNDRLLESRHRVRGLLFRKEEFDAWQRPDKTQRYGANKEGALLQTADGVQFYVNTQWTQTSIQNIIEIAKEEGFDVMIKI